MKLEHTDAELSQQLRQAREALSARTTELDSLKAEWSTKAKSMNVGHAQEITSEREKALQVRKASVRPKKLIICFSGTARVTFNPPRIKKFYCKKFYTKSRKFFRKLLGYIVL